MASGWGKHCKITIFGESHGNSIGVVMDSPPPGLRLNLEEIAGFMARRAPGQGRHTTPRKEPDLPQIQSGFFDGHTTGTPLCAVIPNTDTRSRDYGDMQSKARPGHADYTGHLRYNGNGDIRGGGHFSARLTAPLVFAGAVAMQALRQKGVTVGGHIASIHGIRDDMLDPVNVTGEQLLAVAAKPFPVLDDAKGEDMLAEIEAARNNLDSVGGIVECCALGVPAGVGSPLFDGLENALASLIFGIPAVKGVEFGAGFGAAALFGSQNNDPMTVENGRITHKTNNHGGILGGISSGMPIVVRAAFKPTPSISRPQQTVDFVRGEETTLEITGRHDPCVVPRAVPCVEACVALALLDQLMDSEWKTWV